MNIHENKIGFVVLRSQLTAAATDLRAGGNFYLRVYAAQHILQGGGCQFLIFYDQYFHLLRGAGGSTWRTNIKKLRPGALPAGAVYSVTAGVGLQQVGIIGDGAVGKAQRISRDRSAQSESLTVYIVFCGWLSIAAQVVPAVAFQCQLSFAFGYYFFQQRWFCPGRLRG